MDLYINGKKVYLGEEFTPNFSYKFMDTFDPSAIKAGYSKTVTLHDCKENVEALSPLKERYDFVLYDRNFVRERGYCTLDDVTEEGFKKEYHLTLYGELSKFFTALKGEEDSPKTLCDIRLGFGASLAADNAFTQSLTPTFVYRGWRGSSAASDILKLVPCTWKVNGFDYTKTIIDNSAWAFPTQSSDRSGSCLMSGSRPHLLVTAEENVPYRRGDFRITNMPIAIRYRNIIEGCCETASNGGYKVNLDPDFFNNNNPYWTDMFLMNTVPTALNPPITEENVGKVALYGSDLNVGRMTSSTWQDELVSNGAIPWEASGAYLVTSNSLVDNTFQVSIAPLVEGGTGSVSNNLYFWANGLRVEVGVERYGGGKTQQVLIWDSNDKTYLPKGSSEKFFLPTKEMSFSIPNNWNKIKFSVTCSWADVNNKCYFQLPIQGAAPVPLSSLDLYIGTPPIGYVLEPTLTTTYLDPSADKLLNPVFSKKEYLSNTLTPLDYLLGYTKMFNLRFYVHPGTKEVDILTFENYLNKLEVENIDDRIDYSKPYVETKKLIEESIINFNLEPEPNTTVNKYFSEEGKNILDRRVLVKSGSNSKDYTGTTGLRVGSRARQIYPVYFDKGVGPYDSRVLTYLGFNQIEPYTLGYVQTSGSSYTIVSEDSTPERTVHAGLTGTKGRFDFLEVEDPTNVVVMWGGTTPYHITPYFNVTYSVYITQTSKEMLHYAGKPCFLGGFEDEILESRTGTILGCPYKRTSEIPVFSLTPNYPNYLNGISFANENYDSIIVGSNLFDLYFKDFIDKVYINPKKVTCWVRLENPELRRLYYFNNSYWILTEIKDYNYNDDPVQCTFVRYCK